jgi:phenylpropionate dioxygenase-like ring-hydroxylating dioxygenase large terminal subunit
MYINFWYPICTSEELNEGKPVRAETIGVRLVAFRDSSGDAQVLGDTCIHRGGSLSEGTVTGDSVRCPYHGWEFGGDGKCTKIPSMDGKKVPARAKVDNYPVAEKYGVVFAFLGYLPEEERPPEPIVNEAGRSGWRVTGPIVFDIEGYFERSVENGLDPLHNEFVHPLQGAPRIAEDKVVVADQEWGSSFEAAFAGYADQESLNAIADVDRSGDIRAGSWHVGPNALMTGIYLAENTHFIQYFFEQPVSKTHTRVFFINARNNTLDADKDDWINESFMKIANEDRHVIENLRPFATPDTLTKELLTPGDAPIVRYREYLKDWENRGWRIDLQAVERTRHDVAYAIPSPARSESGNWVIDSIPVVPAG